jgi:magnesium transporter
MLEKILELIQKQDLNELRKYLETINSADFPSIFEELKEDKILIIYRILSKEKAAEVFAELEPDVQEKLINCLTDKELKSVIDELFYDDEVDLIEEMPSNVVKRILKNVKISDRKIINELLAYPDDTAGSIMTPDFIDLKENMTVDEAFEKIRKIALDKETIYTCYVLTADRKIIGIIDIKSLLIADRNAKIQDIMNKNVITVSTLTDQEEVAKMFDKYNFLALPVVDKENRLVGIVTIDDAIDVLQEETEEDFEKMAAVRPNDESYFKTSVFKHARNRIFWLIFLMLASVVTGGIITKYENAFASLPILVAFVPLLMDTGGNCGAQTSTLVIRGFSQDEIKLKDFFRVWWKEIRVGLIVGVTLALINTVRVFIQYGLGQYKLALVLGLTLILVTILSKSLGCILPMFAKRLKLDPAIMASPLITTVVDTCSVLVYFQLAVVIMGL